MMLNNNNKKFVKTLSNNCLKANRNRNLIAVLAIVLTAVPNVQRVKALVDGTPRHIYACTRCLRSDKVQRAL